MESPKMSKPHVVCIPLPAQGHLNPMLRLAKLLNLQGFHITFVHTEYNYNQLLKSRGENSLEGLSDFRFETISDGLPLSNKRGMLDLPELCLGLPTEGLRSFRKVIEKLEGCPDVPPVSFILSDGVMSFTLEVAKELGIPAVVLFTPSGCSLLTYLYLEEARERGYFPLKDESDLTNGYLDTIIDFIPSMKGVRLRELPSFIQTTNPDDIMVNYNIHSVNNSMKLAQGLILNTFDDLEQDVLNVIKTKFPNIYTMGPFSSLQRQLSQNNNMDAIGSNLWKENIECLNWLDSKKDSKPVVYVNFGSFIVMTKEQLREFAWGLAQSGFPFLWAIRPGLVDGADEVLSEEYMTEIKDRGLIVEWCPQDKVLRHASIGGYLIHCGWNSTIETIGEGVPMICWPFFADQHVNCRYSCEKWGVGMEMDSDVKRENVAVSVRKLMEGNEGKVLKETSLKWKEKSELATKVGGSSYNNFMRLVNEIKEGKIGDVIPSIESSH